MKGIITMAIGSPNYGRMAVNLAMSVKHKSKLPIDLIYTESAFKGLEWGLEFFDNAILLPDTDRPSELAMDVKLRLDLYSRFYQTLFLDADSIICPSKSVDEVFGLNVPFTAQCFAINDLTEPQSKYPTWLKYEDILKLFPLKIEDNIPQINSSLIFWRATDERIFSTARAVRDKLKDGYSGQQWRGQIPDEVCFNVACALLNVMPHREVYNPLYMGRGQNKEYIIDNYMGLSLMGKPHWQDVETYNHFARYYAEINGLVKPMYYEQKVKLRPDKALLPHKVVNLTTIGGFGKVSNGGIINPAAWSENGNYKMILRVDENLEGYKGNKGKAKCRPYLAEYSKDFTLLSLEQISIEGWGLHEDWRVIEYEGTKQFGCAFWNGNNWEQVRMILDDGIMLYDLSFPADNDEKNWAWFIHDHTDLHVYSVQPFVVRNTKREVVFERQFKSGWAAKGFISCSTYPVKYGNDYLMWVHKKQSDLTYLNSVMIFDGQTMEPKYFIPDHVLGDAMSHPLYISSCIVEDDRILIFGGEGGVEEMTNAATKYSTVRIIDRQIFDNLIKQYPCLPDNNS